MDQHLRFPIGEFVQKPTYTATEKQDAIAYLAAFPQILEMHVQSLDAAQLATPYRPDGWTINQVVHHLCDSHTHCLIRIKLTLTEQAPTIKPYDEAATATLSDYDLPINYSTTMLHCIHKKMVHLLGALQEEDWHKTCIHPQYGMVYTLERILFLYEWHSKHHLEHIKLSIEASKALT
ncbi:MAG: hypothetical protein RL660_671 [Bacteroidota bacterium]|jgi:hypothetical protein